MKHAKVIVVGAGINGLCTAWALLRRGYQVSVFDQGPIPNPAASSYDEHRIIRHCYGALPAYAAKMPTTFELWEALFSDIGARHFEPLPLVVVERETNGWIEASIGDMDRMNIPWREVPLDEVAGRYPVLRMDGITRAAAFEGAGVLFPIRILTDLVVHLAARGVVFHQGAKVTSIDPETGRVMADGQTFGADHLVVAAGAWITRLLPAMAHRLVPSRQAVVFLAPPPSMASWWRTAPLFLDLGSDSGTYLLPPRPGTRLKIGDHEFTRRGDPDGSRIAGQADVARLLAACRLAWKDFEAYTVLEQKACYYTVTEDEHFVISNIGAHGTVVSACSGHGFKLGPLTGEEAASLIDMT